MKNKKRKYRRLSPADVKFIRKEYKNDVSVLTIAKKLKSSVGSVYRILSQ